MTIVDESVQKCHGSSPWLDTKQIKEKYGNGVLKEIDEIRSCMWDVALEYGNEQSVSEFGTKCRIAAKRQYPLLEERTIDILAKSLEYNYWK